MEYDGYGGNGEAAPGVVVQEISVFFECCSTGLLKYEK